MSEQQWDPLVEALQDPDSDARTRHKAVRQLAATRAPAVIPFLRNAYLHDEDDKVREEAERALARFKAMQAGTPGRGLPISDGLLTVLLAVLTLTLVGSLIPSVLALVDGDDEADGGGASVQALNITPRDTLIDQIETTLSAAQQDVQTLRGNINAYYETQTLNCDPPFMPTTPLGFSEDDLAAYRGDITEIAVTLNDAQQDVIFASTLWTKTCLAPGGDEVTQDFIIASTRLDEAEAKLAQVARDLDFAIQNPPTPTPTITPTATPTATLTPTITPTPVPGTATAIPSETPIPSAPPPEPTETPLPTATATATNTPEPTATLPFPNLDYATILRELNRRHVILGNLNSIYGTGMINQWEKALDPNDNPSVSFCDDLDPWPEPYVLSAADQAALAADDVADPMLEQAVLLQIQGMQAAIQARQLYERDCFSGSLLNSTQDGLPLAQQAFDLLTQSQVLTDAIRER